MTDRVSLPPLLLAYVGDAVFELLVRARLVEGGAAPINRLHKQATAFTRASGQAEALSNLEPFLNEKELEVVKRGRNTKSRIPKSAEMSEYRRATGLEALFGYLYLNGDWNRLHEFFAILYNKR
jgi:ribonuclease-3 family protein